MIPTKDISPNPDQPRSKPADANIEDLAASVRIHGVLQPIIVREAGPGRYQIIAGERRWRAAGRAGLTTIPAFIRDWDEQRQFEVSLIENLQREDLNPIEEAIGYRRLSEDYGLTQEQISREIGKSRTAIANALRLLSLPDEIREGLANREISAGQARPLISLPQTDAVSLYNKIRERGLNARDVESLAKSRKDPGGQKGGRNAKSGFKAVEEKLMHKFGRKARVDYSDGKGKVSLEFYSEDDLMTLVDSLLELK